VPAPPINPKPRTLTDRYAELIGEFQRALAKPRNALCPGLGPLLILVWNRLSRLRRRFAALAGKFHAGTLPAPRTPRRRARPTTERPPSQLPRKPGWLGRLLPEPWWLGGCRDPLRRLLKDPELLALLAATPQAGRLLRPLYCLLGDPPPPVLQLPNRPRRPRPKAEPKPKPPKPVDITRMSAVAWGNFVHPDHPGQHHPPAHIGYGGSWWPPKRK